MRSDKMKYLLPDYITGNLTQEEHDLIEHRIQTDTAFMQEYKQLAKTMTLLSEDKTAAQTPASVNNILVHVNERLDSPASGQVPVLLRPKLLAPTMAILGAISVVLILITRAPSPVLPSVSTQDIANMLKSADYSQLVTLQNQIDASRLVPDVPIESNRITVDSSLQNDLSSTIHKQMFENVSYMDVLQASSTYLSDDELVAALPEQTVGTLLKEVNEKSIL